MRRSSTVAMVLSQTVTRPVSSVTGLPSTPTASKGSSCAGPPTTRFIMRKARTSRTGRQRSSRCVDSGPSEARTVASPGCVHVATPVADTVTGTPDVR
jgi:hypothetical protein